jgi:hypothetical protein
MSNSNLDLLNKVQQFIIDQANASGISLANEFASVQEFKNFVIGLAFKGLIDAGMEVKDAFNATLGDGSYDKLADETFAKLTA